MSGDGNADALVRALERWAAAVDGFRVVRVRRSTGRAGPGAACANPSGGAAHVAGRARWVVTTEKLETLREQKAYVCDACADALLAPRPPR